MALIRRSPRNAISVSPYAANMGGSTTTPTNPSNPYYTGTPQQKVYLQAYADKYGIANRLPAGATSEEILKAAQSSLNSRTQYLQPTPQELAKGNFAQFGPNITPEQYASQRTGLSAATAIGAASGIQTAATGPVGVTFVGGVRIIENTPERYAQFQREIELEEMFGMLGSAAAANIRLAAAQTGAPIPKLIAAENKRLGIRQENFTDRAAFVYQGVRYNREGDPLGATEGNKVAASIPTLQMSEEAKPISQALTPSGGTSNLTTFNNIPIGGTTQAPTTIQPLPAKEVPATTFKTSTGTIATTVVPVPTGISAGTQYRSDFVKATGTDIFRPTIAPTEVRAIKDITGISQGKAPTLVYPDFLGKLTPPGELKGGQFEGLRYADLYQPVSPGSSTLRLTSAGQSFRNLQIKGTPSITPRLR